MSDVGQLAAKARALLSRGGGTESSGGTGPIDNRALCDAVAHTLRRIVAPKGAEVTDGLPEAVRLAAAAAVWRARSALDRTESSAPFDAEDRSALELIVRTIGRPALRYRGGEVEMPPNTLGDNSRWQIVVATARATINALSSRVGRIARDSALDPVLGTGWRVGPDLLVTNRHVARELVVDRERPPSEWRLGANHDIFVDFAYSDCTQGPARYALDGLVYCAEDRWVDLAVFRVKPGNAPLPPPLPIDWDVDLLGRQFSEGGAPQFRGGEVYTVGHPYRIDATEHTRGVFGDADGRKRFSPGLVTAIRDDKPIFLHDCSTLGGNSGSCVISLETATHAVVGLHFGGREETETEDTGLGVANFAVAFGRIKAQKHQAAEIMESGKA